MYSQHRLTTTQHPRQQNSELVFRGRKLVLNYTDGSPCEPSSSRNFRRDNYPHEPEDIRHGRNGYGGDDDDDDSDNHDDEDRPRKGGSGEKHVRRKSSIFSFLCEKDPLAAKAAVSFVAASEDECTYFFEVRSPSACAGINHAKEQLSPGGVFGVMYVPSHTT